MLLQQWCTVLTDRECPPNQPSSTSLATFAVFKCTGVECLNVVCSKPIWCDYYILIVHIAHSLGGDNVPHLKQLCVPTKWQGYCSLPRERQERDGVAVAFETYKAFLKMSMLASTRLLNHCGKLFIFCCFFTQRKHYI